MGGLQLELANPPAPVQDKNKSALCLRPAWFDDGTSASQATNMTTVPFEMARQEWEHLCDLDQAQSTQLSQRFLQEQPALGIYMLVCSEQLGDDHDTPFVELALMAWRVMSQTAGRPLARVSEEAIEAAEAANEKMLMKLDACSEMEGTANIEHFIQDYNQMPLLGFALEVLMQGNEENPQLAPENIGIVWVWLKSIIDCLDQ